MQLSLSKNIKRSMAASLIGGACLGAAVAELLKLVLDVGIKTREFESVYAQLQSTLSSLQSTFYKIQVLDIELNLPRDETDNFLNLLIQGKMLILNCSDGDVLNKSSYAKQLLKLENSLMRFFQIHVQAQLWTDNKMVLKGMMGLEKKIDQILVNSSSGSGSSSGVFGSGGFSDWGGAEVQGVVVGPEDPVEELKAIVDGASVVVISGPPGLGKTTLAKKVCEDYTIKAKFGSNIFFVTVSATPDIKAIVHKLFYDINYRHLDEIPSDTCEIKGLEKLIKDIGIDHMLLVLDDVWPEWEFLIEAFDFQIPGYKRLVVTSRFSFPRFDGYELQNLYDEDGRTLFFRSTISCGSPTAPVDLVNKMVKDEKASPFALEVVSRSLYKQPVFKWKRTVKDWSEGKSFHDHDPVGMFNSIQDPESFSEDEGIPTTTTVTDIFEMDDLDQVAIDDFCRVREKNDLDVPSEMISQRSKDKEWKARDMARPR